MRRLASATGVVTLKKVVAYVEPAVCENPLK